ncbi:MAG: hypothetical protein K6F11_07775 [Lachnospiraceae bacterium]|nr:hypothetical protein [Lachnospiraceae bacterium]
MKRKKHSRFFYGMIIYAGVFALALLVVSELLWTRLENYEVTEQRKAEEQQRKIAKAAEDRRREKLLTPSPTPSPTPEPIILETVKIVRPKGMACYIGGAPEEGAVWNIEEDTETFKSLTAVTNAYPEYEGVLESAFPERESTVVTVEKGTEITFADYDGTPIEPEEGVTRIETDDGEMHTVRLLTCPYHSIDDDKDELTQMGFDFLTLFCLFISNDRKAWEMQSYFPANSQYFKVIASLDNSWFNMHSTPPKYTNHTVRKYVRYNDSLVYMDLSMHQSFVSSWNGQKFDSEVEHPLWFVKIGDKWKVASIIFDAGELKKSIE